MSNLYVNTIQPFTGSAVTIISASLEGLSNISSSKVIGYNSATGQLTAMNTSSIAGIPSFPFTGSAVITGSLVVTGSVVATGDITSKNALNIQGSPGIITVTLSNTNGSGDLLITQNDAVFQTFTLDRFATLTTTSGTNITNFNNITLTGKVSASSFTGSLQGTASFATTAATASFVAGVALLNSVNTFTANNVFSGSVIVEAGEVLTLVPIDPLPSGAATGSFAVSSSAPPKPYFYDGTAWNALY